MARIVTPWKLAKATYQAGILLFVCCLFLESPLLSIDQHTAAQSTQAPTGLLLVFSASLFIVFSPPGQLYSADVSAHLRLGSVSSSSRQPPLTTRTKFSDFSNLLHHSSGHGRCDDQFSNRVCVCVSLGHELC